MKCLFIMNPGSRDGRSRKKFNQIFKTAETCGLAYEYRYTEKLEDAYEFSKAAQKENYDVIAAVGGDGTINNVLRGFFDKNGKRLSKTKMAVIYTGTSPDFCKSYHIPLDTEKAVRLIAQGKNNPISVGMIHYMKENRIEMNNAFPTAGSYDETGFFGCCANIGLGATLARKANSGIRKKLGDTAGTFLALLHTILTFTPNMFRIRKNGTEKNIYLMHSLSVGRTHYIASGIQVRNRLSEKDREFYLLTVQKMNFFRWLKAISQVYSGKDIRNSDFLSLEYCNTIDIAGNNLNSEVEFDGDPKGHLPCSLSFAPDQLDLIREEI